MNTTIDLAVQAPEMLAEYPGIGPDGSGTHLRQLYMATQLATEPLIKTLGLSIDNPRVIGDVSSNMGTQLTRSSDVMKQMLDVELPDEGSLYTNRMPDGMKISKYILKRVKDGSVLPKMIEFLSKRDNRNLYAELRKELKDLPEWDNNFSLLGGLDVFVQNFYSTVASLATSKVAVSFDFFDFFRCSNLEHTKSCFTMGGMYEKSCITYAMGGRTGVIYTMNDKGRPVGRCWVFFPYTGTCFLTQPIYGFMDKATMEVACSWLCHMIKPGVTWKKYELTERWINGYHDAFTMYADNFQHIYYWEDSKQIRAAKESYFDMYSGPTMCVFCGKHHEGKHLVCNDCRTKYKKQCSVCGKTVYSVDKSEGAFVCPDCKSKQVLCPECGAIIIDGKCPACYWKNKCPMCGRVVAEGFKVGKTTVCEACAKALLKGKCTICGNVCLTYPYKDTDEALCVTCLSYITAHDTNLNRVQTIPENTRNKIKEYREKWKEQSKEVPKEVSNEPAIARLARDAQQF